jgi:hypothetical protein
MQESAGWFFGHARIAVRGSGNDTFEETEHASHFRSAVERTNDVDFRSARVCEAGFNSTGHQGTNQTFCAIHLVVSDNPPVAKLLRLAGLSERFLYVTGYCRCQLLVVSGHDSQMIAGHGFHLEFTCQVSPDC